MSIASATGDGIFIYFDEGNLTMTDLLPRLQEFVDYVQALRGDEKGEAQVFCDRLFRAFGHVGYKEAGATLEFRVKAKGKTTKFADLFWESRLLLEMKKRGEKLERHYQQAFEYWLELVPHRPKYVVLCNFDEFWIYDFDVQMREPVDRISLKDLPDRYTALNFLFPENREPIFNNNLIAVTRKAADKVAKVFNRLVERKEPAERAQRLILQCVVALFAEDIDLLPRGLFTELLGDCKKKGASSYDLLGSLFRQMGSDRPAPVNSRYYGVQYFNGGIFAIVEAIGLTYAEIDLLLEAAEENWSKVEPAIFGTLFQSSMGKKERHALGAHYTSEADIQKVILPTIIRPWRERIEAAKPLRDLLNLRREMTEFKVLDPACGSGNFLYVAYREMKRLEAELIIKIQENFSDRSTAALDTVSLIQTKQFYGMDIKPFAVELAKVTLMLGKKLAIDEEKQLLDSVQMNLLMEFDKALPLDNLDANICCEDALFSEWEPVDAIVGNPPYQSKNKMQEEFGSVYVSRVRAEYPEVSGIADYCVYWFRRAHDELKPNGRAGLVGTNTIRQNYSREGGLDYIVGNGGTITEAVSTQVWSGKARVDVSIVNWIKGNQSGKKKLFTQVGRGRNSYWEVAELDRINPALSAELDVTKAKKLFVNANSETCYQGQTHGHKGFLLTHDQAKVMLRESLAHSVIYPYLIGGDPKQKTDLLGHPQSLPSRYVIDLNHCKDIFSAMNYGRAFEHIQQHVLPTIKANAEKEREETNKKTGPRQSHFRHWWKFWRDRSEMMEKISEMPRYIACVRVTKRPIFEFVNSLIHPNDSLQVFSIADDYSFGILQSNIHWNWFNERCSTLRVDFRYTSDTVFDSFPFPQSPTLTQARKVAAAAVKLRQLRRKIMTENQWSLRELYRTLDLPGDNPLREAQTELDTAVREAYGMKAKDDPLKFILELNFEVADRESQGLPVVAPGLPPVVKNTSEFITDDCVKMPD